MSVRTTFGVMVVALVLQFVPSSADACYYTSYCHYEVGDCPDGWCSEYSNITDWWDRAGHCWCRDQTCDFYSQDPDFTGTCDVWCGGGWAEYCFQQCSAEMGEGC